MKMIFIFIFALTGLQGGAPDGGADAAAGDGGAAAEPGVADGPPLVKTPAETPVAVSEAVPELVPVAVPVATPEAVSEMVPVAAAPPSPLPTAVAPPPPPASSATASSSLKVQQRLPEVQVTGERPASYREGEASVGTKIAVPLRDVPQSIQVVPRQVMEDQGAFRPHDLVQNVSGVYRGNAVFGDSFIFRGFSANEFLRDGYPDRRGSMRDTANVEQVEVLKGPASMLFGRLEPGGTLNYVTKRPLFAPYYAVELKTDTHGMVRPAVDVSLVTPDRSLGLRFNGAVEHGGNFRESSFSDRAFGSLALTWRASPATTVSVDLEYLYDRRLLDRGVPRFGAGPADIPVTRLISEPGDDRVLNEWVTGYTVEHRLHQAWRTRHALRFYGTDNQDHRTRFLQSAAQIAGDPSWDGTINRDLLLRDGREKELTTQLELLGDGETAGTHHQLLLGLDLDFFFAKDDSQQANTIVPGNSVNINNPVLGNFMPVGLRQSGLTDSAITGFAAYLQDLITLFPGWKALVGARLDVTHNRSDNQLTSTETEASSRALSPRAGLVWQPITAISLYGSYTQSFVPVIGQDFAGDLFEPTVGRQVEAGVKSELFEGRLTTTLAAFRIRKSNISVPDPVNSGFNLQAGEVTSEGLEVDLAGSPFDGLNLMGNFALIDARTTADTSPMVVGKRPPNTPSRGAGLWASYRLSGWAGWAEGLGFGSGGHYVGRRSGDRLGTFFLPGYTRWDASIWYRRRAWRVALKADNLLDRRYYISSHDTLGIYPGAPREARLSLAYQY
jgi:iron complex outermembrane receptor protein